MVSMFRASRVTLGRWVVYVTPLFTSKCSNIRARDRSQPESFMAYILIVICTHYAKSLDLDILSRCIRNKFNPNVHHQELQE